MNEKNEQNELLALANKLEGGYTDTVHFELVSADKDNDEWMLTVKARKEDGEERPVTAYDIAGRLLDVYNRCGRHYDVVSLHKDDVCSEPYWELRVREVCLLD